MYSRIHTFQVAVPEWKYIMQQFLGHLYYVSWIYPNEENALQLYLVSHTPLSNVIHNQMEAVEVLTKTGVVEHVRELSMQGSFINEATVTNRDDLVDLIV